MFEKLQQLISSWNSQGLPLPMVRDPKTGQGSVTTTLVVVSSGICTVCSLLAVLSAVSKLTGLFANFTEAQTAITNAFNLSFQFFLASGGLYVGRKMQRDNTGKIQI